LNDTLREGTGDDDIEAPEAFDYGGDGAVNVVAI
jgi:hypothetical protein